MKKIMLATALVAGLSAFSGPFAHAEDASHPPKGHKGCGPMHHGFGMPPVLRLKGINLTADQKTKIKAIFEASKPADPKAGMQQMHDLHKQITTLLTTPGPVDQTKLQALTQQIDTIESQHTARHLQTEVQIHDVLTPDQLKEIAAKADEPPKHMHGCDMDAPPPPPPGDDAK
ncbi:MAG: Spy/CpxP family protein refolding chaperone [Acetobacter sp.]|uniref:Spy/CpxP family protein refolding chaperone n=1 Tax=Acetobacter sp. TaxID=440 RepID=UPI0039E7612E